MRLSIISDEISRDIVTSCELASDWGLKHIEVRMYHAARAPQGMSDGDFKTILKVASDHGIDIPSISPGLFKLRLDDPQIAEHRGDLRTRCLDMAEALGSQVMVVFPHVRPEGVQSDDTWSQEVVDDLRETVELAAARGLRVALENEKPCWGATGPSMIKLVDAIDHPSVGVNWDPCNHLAFNGEGHEPGYAAIRERIIHNHVKDATISPEGKLKMTVPGKGDIGWGEQVAALVADGYDGLIVVETHFTPKVASSHACVEAMRALILQAGETVQ